MLGRAAPRLQARTRHARQDSGRGSGANRCGGTPAADEPEPHESLPLEGRRTSEPSAARCRNGRVLRRTGMLCCGQRGGLPARSDRHEGYWHGARRFTDSAHPITVREAGCGSLVIGTDFCFNLLELRLFAALHHRGQTLTRDLLLSAVLRKRGSKSLSYVLVKYFSP